MSAIDEYLRALEAAVRVRGRARRRLLHECRDHLEEASALVGEQEAVKRFGSAAELARAFDIETAARRADHATLGTVAGVLAVGASALAMVNAADPGASAVPVWAVVFFGSAQTAGACMVLAVLQMLAMRRAPGGAADITLLCRRNAWALTAALVTLVGAAGAVPGHGSPVALLTGPAAALLAGLGVLRARLSIRPVDRGRRRRTVRPPLADLGRVIRVRLAGPGPAGLLTATALVAAVAAFTWDHSDQGTLRTSLTAAGIETLLVMTGFVLLGPSLGLRRTRRSRSG